MKSFKELMAESAVDKLEDILEANRDPEPGISPESGERATKTHIRMYKHAKNVVDGLKKMADEAEHTAATHPDKDERKGAAGAARMHRADARDWHHVAQALRHGLPGDAGYLWSQMPNEVSSAGHPALHDYLIDHS